MTTVAPIILQFQPDYVAPRRVPHVEAAGQVQPIDRDTRFPRQERQAGVDRRSEASQQGEASTSRHLSRRDNAFAERATRQPAYGRQSGQGAQARPSAFFLAQQIAQETDPYAADISPERHRAGHTAYLQAAGEGLIIIGPADAVGVVI